MTPEVRVARLLWTLEHRNVSPDVTRKLKDALVMAIYSAIEEDRQSRAHLLGPAPEND